MPISTLLIQITKLCWLWLFINFVVNRAYGDEEEKARADGLNMDFLLSYPLHYSRDDIDREMHHTEIQLSIFEKDIQSNIFNFCEAKQITINQCMSVQKLMHRVWKQSSKGYEAQSLLDHQWLYSSDPSITQEEVTSLNHEMSMAWSTLLQLLQQRESLPEAFIFLHVTVSFDNFERDTNALSHVLEQVLMRKFDAMVVVLYYGTRLDITVPSSHLNTIFLLPVTISTKFKQVPSLNLIQSFSDLITTWGLEKQVLYLNTLEGEESLSDLRNMMIHFLLHQQEQCYHLLKSGAFDVIATNYRLHPRSRLMGNFWWASSRYLSTLRPLNLLANANEVTEHWILSGPAVRLYIAHSGPQFPFATPYPAYCYRSLHTDEGLPPSLPTWKNDCQRFRTRSPDEEENVRMEYEYLHGKSHASDGEEDREESPGAPPSPGVRHTVQTLGILLLNPSD
eukprot:gene2850-3110_t